MGSAAPGDVRGKTLDEAVDALMAKLRRPGNELGTQFVSRLDRYES